MVPLRPWCSEMICSSGFLMMTFLVTVQKKSFLGVVGLKQDC